MSPAQAFQDRLIDFLRQLGQRRQLDTQVGPDTPLFESKILDSVQFLELMSFLEVELAVEVPDRMLSMQYFVTPRAITDNFGPGS